jgi:methylthioribose-1-phosphate isomerase
MKVGDTHYRSIWFDGEAGRVKIIDQRWLPHDFRVVEIETLDEFATAIRDMWVRGAPLIGATAAYGMAQWRCGAIHLTPLSNAAWELLHATRPTAINLRWALDRNARRCWHRWPKAIAPAPLFAGSRDLRRGCRDQPHDRRSRAGAHSNRSRRRKKAGEQVNMLTHCNAGWLATVDWGTATSRSIRPMTPVSRSMSGSMKPARAMPGRSDGLGNEQHHGVPHLYRRQCRRASDAARAGRPGHRGHRPHHARATSATRSAPI